MVDDRMKKYRWPTQVESAVHKLHELLENKPEGVNRLPEVAEFMPVVIEGLISITDYKPQKKPAINITFSDKEKTQRDWMKELALGNDFNRDRTVAEYSKLDAKGDIPRKSRGQSAIDYAQAMWNDGVQKFWLRRSDDPSLQTQVNEVLQALNRQKIRATYSAVGYMLGINPREVSRFLGDPRPEASWVVAVRNGKPTNYTQSQEHEQLYDTPTIISSDDSLRLLVDQLHT